jgi:hypothetical protein
MSDVFGQNGQAFKAAWVSNSGSVSRGAKLGNLAPEQIGIFAANQYCTKEESISLTTPNFKINKRLILKQGLHPYASQNYPALTRHTKHARESVEFEASDILSWTGIKADPEFLPERIAIGYNGLDASKSLSGKLDAKPLFVNIRLSGEPIKRFFHTNFINYRINVDKHLCVGDCDCFDACGKLKCDIVADKILDSVTKDSLFVVAKSGKMLKAPVRQFIKAHKVKKCDTPAVAPTLTEMRKYTISLCDDGSTTIARLAAAYPTAKIELESRIEQTSTYSMWLPSTAPVPADFTLTSHIQPICDVCPTCPDTYTAVPGLKVVQVRVACGSAAPVLAGSVSSTLMSSTLSGGDVYIIKVPLTQTDDAIVAQLTGCLEGGVIGTESKSCVGSTATFEWKTCENCFQTTKDYMIVLPDLNCTLGTDRLAELQDAYPDLVITLDKTGECIHSYKTTMTSNCVAEEDCGKLVTYEFNRPAGYDSEQWVEYKNIITAPDCTVPAASVDPCCVCGVVFETAKWDSESDQCTFGWTTWHPNNDKPVRMQINIHSLDYSDNPCDLTPEYHTVLQRLKVPVGAHGGFVQEKERNFMLHEGKAFETNPFAAKNNGFIITAKEHLFYDQYILRLKKPSYGTSHVAAHQESYDYIFYVPSGEGKALEKLINELVLSAGNPDLRAVML